MTLPLFPHLAKTADCIMGTAPQAKAAGALEKSEDAVSMALATEAVSRDRHFLKPGTLLSFADSKRASQELPHHAGYIPSTQLF